MAEGLPSRQLIDSSNGPLSGFTPRLPSLDLLVSLATVAALVRIGMVCVLPYARAVGTFDDDAFYYFGIARNIAAGKGSTFNGLDLTNGYHPLWQLILVPVFGVFHGRAALTCVTVLSAVLFIMSAALLSRLGRLIDAPMQVSLGATPLLIAGAAGPSFWFSGMETGVLLLALIAIAVIYVQTKGLRVTPSVTGAALLGLLLALTVLARLDAVFATGLLGLVAIIRWRRLPCLIALAIPPGILLSAYLVLNLILFRTAWPVSMQAKALGGSQGLNGRVFVQFLSAPIIFGVPCWLGLIALVVTPAAVIVGRRDRWSRVAAAEYGLLVLIGGFLAVAYFSLTSSWHMWPWYFYAAPLATALAAPVLMVRLKASLRLWRFMAVAACIMALAAVALQAIRVAQGAVTRAAFVEAGPIFARRLEELAPSGIALAMGDRAGSVGYHLRLPMVHLEGLVNSAEYLEALRTGTVPEFLATRHVDLYGRGDAAPGKRIGDGCRSFDEPTQGNGPKTTLQVCDADLLFELPLPDGTSYRVWRYRPELNKLTATSIH